MFHSAQLPDVLTTVNFQLLKLEEAFVYPKQMLFTLLNNKGDIIWSAWSRCNLQKEKAYATL